MAIEEASKTEEAEDQAFKIEVVEDSALTCQGEVTSMEVMVASAERQKINTTKGQLSLSLHHTEVAVEEEEAEAAAEDQINQWKRQISGAKKISM